MGRTQAMGMAECVGDGMISLEQAVEYQLRVNHFPPVPYSMIPVCIKAIENANEGNWDGMVDLPEGTSYRGSNQAPTSAIIQGHHLEFFLEQEEEEEEEEVSNGG